MAKITSDACPNHHAGRFEDATVLHSVFVGISKGNALTNNMEKGDAPLFVSFRGSLPLREAATMRLMGFAATMQMYMVHLFTFVYLLVWDGLAVVEAMIETPSFPCFCQAVLGGWGRGRGPFEIIT